MFTSTARAEREWVRCFSGFAVDWAVKAVDRYPITWIAWARVSDTTSRPNAISIFPEMCLTLISVIPVTPSVSQGCALIGDEALQIPDALISIGNDGVYLGL